MMQNPIVILDSEKQIIFANDAFYTFAGLANERILYVPITDISCAHITTDEFHTFIDTLYAHRASQCSTIEIAVPHHGETCHMRITGRFLPTPEPTDILAILTFVRIETTGKIEQKNAPAANEIVFRFNTDKRVTYVNHEIKALTNSEAGNYIDKHVSEIDLFQPVNKQLTQVFEVIAQTRSPYTFIAVLKTAGGLSSYQLHVSALFRKDATFDSYIVFLCDISKSQIHNDAVLHENIVLKEQSYRSQQAVRETSQKLKQAQTQLDKNRRLSDIGTLASTVAHELRNPLGVIKTALYNIRRKRTNSAIDRHLDNIDKKVAESVLIINNLVNYARIKEPTYETVNLVELVDSCIEHISDRYAQLTTTITKKYISSHEYFIDTDPNQLSEILGNILINAFQAANNQQGDIAVSIDVNPTTYAITITDNGAGIDAETLEKVFDPFFSTKAKGTGLGMTIANELIHLHNGSITIHSEEGQGTAITITVPQRHPDK